MLKANVKDRLEQIEEQIRKIRVLVGGDSVFLQEGEAIAALALITDVEADVNQLGNELEAEVRKGF